MGQLHADSVVTDSLTDGHKMTTIALYPRGSIIVHMDLTLGMQAMVVFI